MHITNLRLVNFRVFDDRSFDFKKGINIIIGPNAIGKTSLIEALYLINEKTTFRQDENIIKSGKDWSRIETNLSNNKHQTIKLPKNTKNYQTDLKEKNIKTIIFEPNQLFLFYQSPAERRQYIDRIIEQEDPEHSKTLNEYKRVLLQRNTLLKKGKGTKETLFVWDVKLVELAKQIVEKRDKCLKTLDEKITDEYRKISGGKENIKIKYSTNPEVGDAYSTNLMKLLTNNLAKDTAIGYTSSGPHRDDVIFEVEGKGAKTIASRGEIRTILLALKKIEATKSKNIPVILLDDVFSELDSLRRQRVVKTFSDYQVFITTTEADLVIKKITTPHNTIVI